MMCVLKGVAWGFCFFLSVCLCHPFCPFAYKNFCLCGRRAVLGLFVMCVEGDGFCVFVLLSVCISVCCPFCLLVHKSSCVGIERHIDSLGLLIFHWLSLSLSIFISFCVSDPS